MKPYIIILTYLSFIFLPILIVAQNISGKVLDDNTIQPLPYTSVFIPGTDPIIGTTTDENGRFTLSHIPAGRYSLQVSYIGYEPVVVPEILVTNAKEVTITIRLRQISSSLQEIVVKPRIQKNKALNSMAAVSAKMLSVEEANRYAGGFDDPARLASSFAGVASNISNNAIIIRGNAPKFLQWKMEGIEIPNPNHFADMSTFGGGGLTALSSQLLANSDFYTGAFPAEYNNALAGVFDIKMRAGNNTNYEHSFQIGVIGIDLSSEGPLNKQKNGSYLFNYRYSMLGLLEPLLPDDAGGTNYQDLAFKVKLQPGKAGTISIWGIGLIDNSGQKAETDPSLWIYYQDVDEMNVKQYMGASGIQHNINLGKTAYASSTLAYSTSGLDLKTDRINNELTLLPQNKINNQYQFLTFKSVVNKQYNINHSNTSGLSVTYMDYNLLLKESKEQNGLLSSIVLEKGGSYMASLFTNEKINLNKITANVGATVQYFGLNKNTTIEPRIGAVYKMDAQHELSIGYGLHSRIEPLNIYYIERGGQNNNNLGFTKAHHFVCGFEKSFSDYLHLRVEPYFQYLFDVPIIADSTYSLLNLQNDWFFDQLLVNQGKGKNYGIDITLEQFMKNGLYFIFTSSLFRSQYSAADKNTWFNTRYNRNFLFNALIGKEYNVGKQKDKLLGANFRLGIQGGDRFSRIDQNASISNQDVVFDEKTPYTEQAPTAIVSHVTINYIWNKEKSSHVLSLKILNANAHKEFLGHRFNIKTQHVEAYKEALFIPNLSYKVSF